MYLPSINFLFRALNYARLFLINLVRDANIARFKKINKHFQAMEVYYIYPTLTVKVTMTYENKFKDMKHFNNKSFYLIHRISSGTKNITFSFMNKKKIEYVNTIYKIDNLFLHLASSVTVLMFYDSFCLLLVFTFEYKMCKNKK